MFSQSTGVAVGMAVRQGLLSASVPAAAACHTVACMGLGVAVHRASSLITAAILPPERAGALASRIATAAVPVAAAAITVAWATGAGALPAAGAYLSSKLVQRGTRYLLSNSLSNVAPSYEVIDRKGHVVSRQAQEEAAWGRAITTALPTTFCVAAQEFLAPAPDDLAGAHALTDSLTYVAAAGLVEAARALYGTLTAAAFAHAQERTLQPQAAGGGRQLLDNITSLRTLRESGDATAMREYFGIMADMVAVLAGQPTVPLRAVIVGLLRAELKALGDFRTPLVTYGQIALSRAAEARAPTHQPLREMKALGSASSAPTDAAH
ncbi:hypothetical protein WG922_04470 [Ramlibacter sp. AN1015]|uniref:hypothetical protein n=1 Tax=Ramlibacter sp. AN1015 TaxID=3133428 RepID=UPI0030BDD69F